jgi:hypothetical protein
MPIFVAAGPGLTSPIDRKFRGARVYCVLTRPRSVTPPDREAEVQTLGYSTCGCYAFFLIYRCYSRIFRAYQLRSYLDLYWIVFKAGSLEQLRRKFFATEGRAQQMQFKSI